MHRTDGWEALNLEMPERIPRTEYSVEMHWDLLKAITGIDVRIDSPDEVKRQAQKAFYKAWKIDLFWSTLVGSEELAAKSSSMGHAEYMQGGVDWDDNIYQAFKDPREVYAIDMDETYGVIDHNEWVKKFSDHYWSQAKANPDAVCMTGVYTTCVSGLISMLGWDMLLLSAGDDPVRFGDVINRYCRWTMRFFEALADSDAKVVMIHDDMVWSTGPIFSPAFYREYVFPNLKRFVQPLRDTGKKVLFTSDGDYTIFLQDVVDCGVHGMVMEPMTSLEYAAKKFGQTHVLIGNADTRILLNGTREQIRAEVERCMGIGRSCPGFFMAVGNHIPPNTPVESALYYNEVYESLCLRR